MTILNELATINTKIEHTRETIQRLTNEPITDATDARLETFWAKTRDIADEHDMCSVYDELMEDIGAPTRNTLHDYDVDTEITITITINIGITAYEQRDTEDAIDTIDNMDEGDIRDALDNSYPELRNHDYEIEAWDAKTATIS